MRFRAFGVGLALALVSGCAPRQPPPGLAAADPADSCGPQVVVFVSAGDLLGEPPRHQRPPSAEELASELARENAAIDRLQIAFDALLYCRWTEVRVIRADAASNVVPKAEASVRLAAASGRLRADLRRAQQLRQRLSERSARLEAAVERAAPGTASALLAERAARDAPVRAVASAPVALRLRPELRAPEVGRVPAGTEVSLRPATGGFGLVDGGLRAWGYGQLGAFTVLQQRRAPVTEAVGPQAELRRLAATNLVRRDNFAESLDLAERSAEAGFEPAM